MAIRLCLFYLDLEEEAPRRGGDSMGVRMAMKDLWERLAGV
jgi:hypothetical protein